ncbi:MAG: hypothetical protein HY700_21075 [Gemmatimonadetes bacterium]|nr:hypothetical protein [Gemmatimonadota bacterium]
MAATLDPDGRQVVGATVASSSVDTSVASVSVSGLVTGRSPGRTTARAQALAIIHDVPIIVPNPTRSIEVQPDSVVVDEGGTQLLTAVAVGFSN